MKTKFKSFILPLLAILALASPALALDPHDAQISVVTNTNILTSAGPQTVTLTTLTSRAVNSGTNSYFIRGIVKFNVPVNGPTTLRLLSGASTVLQSYKLGGEGYAVIEAEVEGVPVSTVFSLQIVANNTGDTIKSAFASLAILGLAGATQ